MTVFPAPLPEPAHPLDYWLAPGLSQISPDEARSRLRDLADAQGTILAAWGSGISGGAVFLIAGIFLTTVGAPPGWAITLAGLGICVLLLSLAGTRRTRSRLPNTRKTRSTRGPGSARGGIRLVLFFAVALGVPFAAGAPGVAAQNDTRYFVGYVGGFVLLMLFLVACVIVPSSIMGRSRETFRRRATTDPAFRALLEQDLATWRDPIGNASYGPL
ncbi:MULTISPECIES: hypothetical protein [Arthrobacter]|uniref:Uncharacterized protein n=2 Tax=Arthrobacter TaxID=1663 RepID=A0ABU9KKC0_9MICC|nr:hypothetical protein [Arthrobacter sp. YJM1]MDP5227045.1 hypothetical protein [Arthrobacter sp. YJM1]